MSRLIWAPPAQRQLCAIVTWYRQFDPDLPERLIGEIEAAAAKLVDFPLLGAALPDSTDRKWRARGTPFILIYRPTRSGVRVLQIVHEVTDWKPK